jgi:hypothetical protein
VRTPAPWLGQHNRELLSELNVDAAAYERLLAAEVVAESPGSDAGTQE